MDERPLLHRFLALLALLALLAAFGVTGWWILNDEIHVGERPGQPSHEAASGLP